VQAFKTECVQKIVMALRRHRSVGLFDQPAAPLLGNAALHRSHHRRIDTGRSNMGSVQPHIRGDGRDRFVPTHPCLEIPREALPLPQNVIADLILLRPTSLHFRQRGDDKSCHS